MALPIKWKEIANILSRKYDNKLCLNDFKILKKSIEVWKLWDLSISHDIICGGCGKIWVGFAIFSRMILTIGNICEEESECWEGCDYVWSGSDDQIWVGLQKIFYSQ